MKSWAAVLGCAAILLSLAVPAAGEESNGFVLLPPDEMAAQQAIMEECRGGNSEWFSVGAMFVAFREALEACVIVSVMVNILNKVRMPHFNRFVWWGSGVGMFISILGGVGIVAGYYAASNALMSYRDKAAFSGTFSLIAALFLSALAIQFLRFKDVEVKYRKKMAEKTEGVKATTQSSAALSMSMLQMWNDPELKDTVRSIFVLCFAAVLREGLECFVFLAAFASHTPPAAIAIGAVVGLIIGGLFGYVFLIMGRAMKDLRWFLGVATVFMLFISAGLMALTASAFKTVALTDMGKVDTDFALTSAVYDIYKSTGEGHQTCGFWAVIRAIIGYTHNPSMLWWIVYLTYWAVVLSILGYRYWTGTLFSKWGNNPFEETDSEHGKSSGSDASSDIEQGPMPPVPPQQVVSAWAPGIPMGGSPPVAGMPMMVFYSPPSQPMQTFTAEHVQGVNFGAGVGSIQPAQFHA
jgi:high-affinity iron transporter